MVKAPAPVPAVMPPKSTASITAAVPELPVSKSAALGQPKVLSAWRCTDPLDVAGSAHDPIGNAIKKDAERSEHCR